MSGQERSVGAPTAEQSPSAPAQGDVFADIAATVAGIRTQSVADLWDVLDGSARLPADLVWAGDETLPMLAHEHSLGAALATALTALCAGGLFLAAVPELGRLKRLRPTAPPPRVSQHGDNRKVTVQLWDWAEDGQSFELEVVRLERRDGHWSVAGSVSTKHRVLSGEEIEDALFDAGFQHVQRHPPAETGYPIPVWAATAPA